MDTTIPPEIRQFILDRIDSIAELEALLLLRNTPDTWWEDAASLPAPGPPPPTT